MWAEGEKMNNVVLIGRLTNDPELKTVGDTVNCRATLAVNRMKKGEADFIPVTFWGKTAENVCKYMTKGRQLAVEGRIQTGSYTNKDGQKVYTTDVMVNHAEFIGDSKSSNSAPAQASSPAATPQMSEEQEMEEIVEDIPF